MKKLGIFLFAAGIVVMLYATVDFIRDKQKGSPEEVKKQNTPFPWIPSLGAILVASGIITMATDKKKTKV